MPQPSSNNAGNTASGAASAEMAARLENISVVYGAGHAAVHAVRDVSLDVRRGEVLLLMGPSGSGKSTLLQVLGCIRTPTSGTVYIGDRTVQGTSQNDLSVLRRDQISFIFQHYNLLPTLRAWENVAVTLELRGGYGPAIEDASRRTLSLLGLSHRANAYPDELSGGEKQRVAIARAVVCNPDLILADEPTAALDGASGADVARLLTRVAHEQGRAVVIVTHDVRIIDIADRIVFLEDGAIRSTRKNIQIQRHDLQESGSHEAESDHRAEPRTRPQRSTALGR
jgi:putative ABC transport system ATP-binding protein